MNLSNKSQILYNYKYNQSDCILRKGQYGIKSMSFGRLTVKQITFLENMIIKISKKIINSKKSVKIWNKVVLNFNLTKLSSESRMGKGKGSVYTQGVFIKPGKILFELESCLEQQAQYIVSKINNYCSLKLVLIKR
uniref:ribosomal protein L16 n=1 Tax=Hypnea spinella TaxID=105608 RepID=UPI0030032678|nr:ribosomal protein L16 [Hypnea spinella]